MEQVIRDCLAVRGESPGLLPLLEEGEESAVLTISDQLKATLISQATEATLKADPLRLDELKTLETVPKVENEGWMKVRMPADYLKLHTLRMSDWNEALTEVEPEGSLRRALGANAPEWLICRERPMVTEGRDTEGIYLKIYGSESGKAPAELLYVPLPRLENDTLVISEAAYSIFLSNWCETR